MAPIDYVDKSIDYAHIFDDYAITTIDSTDNLNTPTSICYILDYAFL
jgi:hypothetical protein